MFDPEMSTRPERTNRGVYPAADRVANNRLLVKKTVAGVLALICLTAHVGAQASLVGTWVVEGETLGSRNLPQPWGRQFTVTRDAAQFVIETEGHNILTYELSGQSITPRDPKSGAVTGPVTTSRRADGRIVIETQSGPYHRVTTLTVKGDQLTVYAGPITGGTGEPSPAVAATYKRAAG